MIELELTNDDEKILDGDCGETRKLAMQLLYNFGELKKAQKLIAIKFAQVSDVSYKDNVELIKLLNLFNKRGIRTSIPTYFNYGTTKQSNLKQIGIGESQISANNQVLKLYKNLGVNSVQGGLDGFMEQFVSRNDYFTSSNQFTVISANSQHGARANLEPLAVTLASGILGKSPLYGLYYIENRIPNVIINTDFSFKELEDVDYTLIGYLVGKQANNKIPIFRKSSISPGASEYNLRALAYAMAHTGQISLFHIDEVTPEHRLFQKNGIERKIRIQTEDLTELREKYRAVENPDLVIIGGPPVGPSELIKISRTLNGKKLKPNLQVWLFISGKIMLDSNYKVYTKQIVSVGVRIFYDMDVTTYQFNISKFRTVLTNSIVILRFFNRFPKINTGLGTIQNCITTAISI